MKEICISEAKALYCKFRKIKRKIITTASCDDLAAATKICKIYSSLLAIERDFYNHFLEMEICSTSRKGSISRDDVLIARMFAARMAKDRE